MDPSEHKSNSEILLYQTEDVQTRLEVQLHAETFWLSLNQLAELEHDRVVANFCSNWFGIRFLGSN
jgi:hypothetical protein